MELERNLNPKLEYKTFKAARIETGAQGLITALVSTYDVDRANEKVMPGAFKASLARKLPKGVWAHDWSMPIAKTLEAKETPEGLVIKGQFNLDTQRGREAYSDLKFGSIDSLSFGFRVIKDSYAGDSKDIRQLDEIEIFEWSPCLVGCNDQARVLELKQAAFSEESEMPANVEYKDEDSKPIRPNFGGHPNGQVQVIEQKGIGERFIESREYQDFLRSHSRGSESGSVTFDVGLKTLMTTTTGWVPETPRSSLIVPYATRMPEIMDVIPTIQTNNNAFTYIENTTWTNAAVETAEGALKPEAAMVMTEKVVQIRKIPVWIPLTDEQIEDVPGIQDWVESQLGFMVRQRLETEIIQGDGVTPNLLGIMHVPGVQTQAKGTDPTPDAIFKAMTKVRVTGRARPSAVLIHPNDWAEVQLLRTTDGIYIAGSPWDSGPSRIWGVPVIVSDAVLEGTAITGDFQNYSLLVERKSLTIKVGYSGTQFLENIRSIVAEIRVGMVWSRPTAFCYVTSV